MKRVSILRKLASFDCTGYYAGKNENGILAKCIAYVQVWENPNLLGLSNNSDGADNV